MGRSAKGEGHRERQIYSAPTMLVIGGVSPNKKWVGSGKQSAG